MIEQQVLEKVWPDKAEADRAQQKFEQIRTFIDQEFGLDAQLMGSLAKQTFIAGDKDLDIFIFFNQSVPEDQLEEKGLEVGKKVFNHFGGEYIIEYAEHPYTQGQIDGFDVEIVPAYTVDSAENIQSSVDRTPFHTHWVNNTLSTEQKKQVVLLKAFLKGRGLYGSSLKVEGFSGYLCEILIAHHGTFQNLLQSAVNWPREQIIDVENHHDELPEQLKERFENEQLIVIDPIDPERNVASVLSPENYAQFIYEAWQYLENPEESFFFPEQIQPDRDAIEQETNARNGIITIEFKRPELVDDILYPQLRRLQRRVEKLLHRNEFELFESDFFVGTDIVRLVLDLKIDTLPPRVKHRGPQVFHNQEHLANFTSKYDRVWVENGKLTTIVERQHTQAEQLLNEFLSGDLQEKGVPKNLVDAVEDRKIGKAEFKGEQWLRFLMDFLCLA